MRWPSPHPAPEHHRTVGRGGVALGRSPYVHLQRPLPPVRVAQAARVTALAGPVIVPTLERVRGLDPIPVPAVEEEEGAHGRP